MPASEWTEAELRAYVDRQYNEDADQHDQVLAYIERWLSRGDGAAVYENHDLGHPGLGLCKIASYGSAWAQLEVETPPTTLPDSPTEINWRYQLIATCRRQVTFDVDLTPAKPGPAWEWPDEGPTP